MKAIVSISSAFGAEQLALYFPSSATGDDWIFEVLLGRDIATIEDILQQEQCNGLILLYSRAEHFLAKAMSSGQSLTNAASDWELLITQVLALQKQNRQRLWLVNADLLLQYPDKWPQDFAEHHVTPAKVAPKEPVVDLALLTACQYLQQNQHIQRLNALLIASSYPITMNDASLCFDLENVMQQNFLLQQRQQQSADEIELVKVQLRKAQLAEQRAQLIISELEQYKDLNSTLLSSCRLQLAEQTQVVNQYQSENTTMLQQLCLVQEKLEEQLSINNQLEQQQLAIIKKNNEFQDELKNLQSSKFQTEKKMKEMQLRINTVPEPVTDVAELTQLKQENKEMLEQLFKVQQQLEQYYFDLQHAREISINLCSAKDRLQCAIELNNKLSKMPAKKITELGLILGSTLFDPLWYRQRYLDGTKEIYNEAEHFLTFGVELGFSPGPGFDVVAYLTDHKDVALAKVNPLIHFENYGRGEGRLVRKVESK